MIQPNLYKGFFDSKPLSSQQREACLLALELIQGSFKGKQPQVVQAIRQLLQEDRIRANPSLQVKALSIRIPLTPPRLQINFDRFCPPTFSARVEREKLSILYQRGEIDEERFRGRGRRIDEIERRSLLELTSTLVHEASHVVNGHSLSRKEDERVAYTAERDFLLRLPESDQAIAQDLLKDLLQDASEEGVPLS